MHDVVKAGKARYIGASSMYAWQFAQSLDLADRHGWTRFATMQNHYNLVYREEEREMNPLCQAGGVGLIPWSPLARGFLAGNRKKGEENPSTRASSDDFAHRIVLSERRLRHRGSGGRDGRRKRRRTRADCAGLAAASPGVTAPVVGATKLYQLDEAIAALDIELSAADMERLEEPYQPHPVLGHG